MNRFMAVLLAAVAAMAANAETFSWKHVSTYSASKFSNPDWKSFGDGANWAIGQIVPSENTNNDIPTENDEFYFGLHYYPETTNKDFRSKIACIDLDGKSYAVKSLIGGDSQWLPYVLLLKNGSLEFSDSFTNNETQVHIYEGGKFVHGAGAKSLFGTSTSHTIFHCYSGSEFDFGGEAFIVNFDLIVEDGAKAVFDPSKFAFSSSANVRNAANSWSISNSGTVDLPNGFAIGGYWTPDGPCTFVFKQESGVLNVGGNFVKKAQTDGHDNNNNAHFILSGGTVNANEDVAFERFDKIMMTNDAVVTANVAAGKTLYLNNMTFMPGTELTKTGPGTVKFGASVPAVLNVLEGAVEPTVAVKFDKVAFAQGGELHLNLFGVSAREIDGCENATLVVSDELINSGKPFFKVDSEADAQVLASKISAPEGFEIVANSATLTVEKPHEGSVFYWLKENGGFEYYSFYDPAYWGIGKTVDSTNEGGWIPGEDDEIYYGNAYQRYLYFDMKGGDRKVKALNSGLNPTLNVWGKCYIGIKNGTLEFTSGFTNGQAVVEVAKSGRFVLGEGCGTLMGQGGMTPSITVKSGGECAIGGYFSVHKMKASVEAGGKLEFNPSSFAFAPINYTVDLVSPLSNFGTLKLPNGIELTGESIGGNCTFSLRQYDGDLELGGNIADRSETDHLDFNLTGGVVRVTNDAKFIGCRNVVMTNDAAAEISVAAGKTADFSAMKFMDGTRLEKTGEGALRLGAEIPRALAVESGSFVVVAAVDLGSALTMGAGTRLVFAAGGVRADEIANIAEAEVSVEEGALGHNTSILVTGNDALLAALEEKLAQAVKTVSAGRRRLEVVELPDEPGKKALKAVSDIGLRVIVK